MGDDYISVGPGDEITANSGIDGYPAVRIQNMVWVEPPRWLLFGPIDGDQEHRINELIDTLTELRDSARNKVRSTKLHSLPLHGLG